MEPDWSDELQRLRPQMLAQKMRLQELINTAMESLRSGEDVSDCIEALTEGERHPVLGVEVGRDFLADALIAAWELAAGSCSVEEVMRQVQELHQENLLPPLGHPHLVTPAIRMMPYVSTLAASILLWDRDSSEGEQFATMMAWSRFAAEDTPLEVFSAYADHYQVPLSTAVRTGLLLLAWLEHLIVVEAIYPEV